MGGEELRDSPTLHASPTVCSVNDDCGDATPGSALVGDRNKEDGNETEESARFSCDEDLCTGIGNKLLEPAW